MQQLATPPDEEAEQRAMAQPELELRPPQQQHFHFCFQKLIVTTLTAADGEALAEKLLTEDLLVGRGGGREEILLVDDDELREAEKFAPSLSCGGAEQFLAGKRVVIYPNLDLADAVSRKKFVDYVAKSGLLLFEATVTLPVGERHEASGAPLGPGGGGTIGPSVENRPGHSSNLLRMGRVKPDVYLVNNAGYLEDKWNAESFEKHMAVNCVGPLDLTERFVDLFFDPLPRTVRGGLEMKNDHDERMLEGEKNNQVETAEDGGASSSLSAIKSKNRTSTSSSFPVPDPGGTQTQKSQTTSTSKSCKKIVADASTKKAAMKAAPHSAKKTSSAAGVKKCNEKTTAATSTTLKPSSSSSTSAERAADADKNNIFRLDPANGLLAASISPTPQEEKPKQNKQRQAFLLAAGEILEDVAETLKQARARRDILIRSSVAYEDDDLTDRMTRIRQRLSLLRREQAELETVTRKQEKLVHLTQLELKRDFKSLGGRPASVHAVSDMMQAWARMVGPGGK
eukprot:g7483.t1